ncbi:MAG: RAMP superfamily CRISPR-associated protein [Candidatus Hodarchaeota archaeon]
MNPYDFVRTDWTKPPERRGPIFHHKFDGVSGKIECQLIAETLIFIPTSELDQSSRGIFSTHRNEYGMLDSGAYFIPGSSLKGLFRSLVEVVGNGCYSIFDGKYEKDKVYYVDKISTDFKKCENLNSLCIGCRLFGFLKVNKVYKGLVQISDADFIAGEEYGKFILHSIGGPNPRHDAFYLDEKKEQLSGRKFYFHSMKQLSGQEGDFNAPTIYPLKAGALFHFNIHFNNLTQSELDTLLYAIVLEENMRHKIGYAKPFGFGSVKIEIDQLN